MNNYNMIYIINNNPIKYEPSPFNIIYMWIGIISFITIYYLIKKILSKFLK